jgi:hypothetical protein
MKKIFYTICSLFFILITSTSVFSQKLENVQFKQDGKKIIITYDLDGVDDSKTYEILVEMSQDGGITYTTTPKTIQGDIGKEIKSGKSKKITWDVLKDVAELHGTNFVFKVIANEPGGEEKVTESKGGIPTWVWIGGGAAVLGGAAAILLGGSKSNGTTTTTSSDLPTEPSWPN